MNDAELRERFAEWAQPLRSTPPPAVTTIRRRARRHVVGLAATSGLMLVAVGLGAGLVASGVGAAGRPAESRPLGSAKYPAPPGQPYVFVNGLTAGRAEVRDAATGAVVTVLQPPGHGGRFTAAAAAPGDRLFVLGERAATGQTTFAELHIRVSRAGVTVRLAPVLDRVHLGPGTLLISMSVNATGTRLALSASPAAGTAASSLRVYDLSSGAELASWQPPGPTVSTQQFIGGADELAVFWPTSGPQAGDGGNVPLELRLVDTAADFPAGSPLVADSRAGPPLSASDGSFSQDGSLAMNTFDGAVSPTPQSRYADLIESDAMSGRLLWTVQLGPVSALRGPDFCGVLWASANGRDLLAQCGTRQLSIVDGKARAIHLPWIFPALRNLGTSPFAW